MSLKRGDIVLVRFPHDSGGRGKKRPAVVVQADKYNLQLNHFILAEITTNLSIAVDPANLLIDIATPDGQQTGLQQDSVVTCWHLVTLNHTLIRTVIGSLSPALLLKLDDCLKAALQLP